MALQVVCHSNHLTSPNSDQTLNDRKPTHLAVAYSQNAMIGMIWKALKNMRNLPIGEILPKCKKPLLKPPQVLVVADSSQLTLTTGRLVFSSQQRKPGMSLVTEVVKRYFFIFSESHCWCQSYKPHPTRQPDPSELIASGSFIISMFRLSSLPQSRRHYTVVVERWTR